jgi:hypothetical protein
MEEKRDFRYRRYRSLFWPILLIGAGVVWMLANLNLIPAISWRLLIRMWPLFLIVAGLDVLFGRRSPIIGGLIGLGAVALVVGLLYFAPSLDLDTGGELKTLTFTEPIGGATSARIDLDLERYPTMVETVSSSNLLIEAELDTFTDVAFTASGDQKKSVRLEADTDYSFDLNWLESITVDARWEIGLSPDVPLDLTVDVGSGSATLDLMDLDLTDLMIDGGSGSVDLTLPASASEYDVEIDGGSGSFNMELADGADIRAEIEVGSGHFDIEIGSGADFEARIDGGSGSITIDVPNNVGVRVDIEDSGSGSVRVPSKYNLVDDYGDDDRDTGVWESDGFSSASHRVEITYDGGSGSFTLR